MNDHDVNKAIDKITMHLTSAEALNVMHACRPGHPLNNPWQWRNARQYLDRGNLTTTERAYFERRAQEEALS